MRRLLDCDQFLEADWKIKIAVKTPTRAVTAKATVGKGDVSPKFSRRPLPVAISMLIATAKPTIASRPSHTSKLLPSSALCSHLIETNFAPLHADFRRLEDLHTKSGEPETNGVRIVTDLEMGRRGAETALAELEAHT